MMNVLRRIASLPGLRSILLQPAVRRFIASVLALRFLKAAFLTVTPARFAVAELVTSRGRIRSWALREGGNVTLLHGRDLEAFHELMVAGEYVPPTELQARLAQPSKILDLGGNIGMFAHWAHQQWPAAQIVSFEPDPANLTVFRAGVTPEMPIEVVGAAAMTGSGHAVLSEGSGAGRTVVFSQEPVTGSLPAVDIFEHLDGVDFVKMDIEGGEWPILEDPRMSSLGRMMWVIEYHRRGAPSLPAFDAARTLFEAAGFTVGHNHPNYWGHGVLWAWKD